MDIFAGTFGAVAILFLIATAVLWFFLPFAVFGIKKRLDQSNRATADLLRELRAMRTGEPVAPPADQSDSHGLW